MNDKGTISSISTDDQKCNPQRSLARSKMQVKVLQLDSKKDERKIARLTKELKVAKQKSVKEKKATNALLESSQIESAKVFASAKSLIKESKDLKRSVNKIRAKEKSKTTKLVREEQNRASKKLNTVK